MPTRPTKPLRELMTDLKLADESGVCVGGATDQAICARETGDWIAGVTEFVHLGEISLGYAVVGAGPGLLGP